MTRYVAVLGPGSHDPVAEELAERVGRLLAERGAVLVTGGLGGAMEAASRGAKQAGGMTVGILPDDTRQSANRYLDVAVPTGLGEMRNAVVVRASDGAIAIRGAYGTLSEIGLSLRIGRPVVGIDTWMLNSPDGSSDHFHHAKGPEEAVNRLMEMLEED